MKGSYVQPATLQLERLGLSDVPEITIFLNRVWGAAYGSMPRPVFTEEYLHWIYGGPYAASIIGVRKEGRIVSVKSLLPREIAVGGGPPRRAYLGTHLAIDPLLPLTERLGLMPMADQTWLGPAFCVPGELGYAIVDADKPLLKRTEGLLAKQCVSRTIGTFWQMVVAPVLIERSPTNLTSRPGTIDDVGEIVALARQVAQRASLAEHVTEAVVAHRWFNAPDGQVLVTESGSRLAGACCVYRLRTARGSQEATVAVLESFLVTTVEAGIALLRSALAYAQRIKARGLVLENATWLETPRAYGLMPSGRRMQLAVTSRVPIDIGNSWLLDVK